MRFADSQKAHHASLIASGVRDPTPTAPPNNNVAETSLFSP